MVRQSPDRIYASGLATFVQQFGVDVRFAMAFVLLAFATFIFDTLDVATRLGRYILQELFGWEGRSGRILATLATLALPAWFVTISVKDPAGNPMPAWKAFWVVFGTSNQLLAGLTLLGLSTWFRRSGKAWVLAAIPCFFMLFMTLWALGVLLIGWMDRFRAGGGLLDPIGVASLLLVGLALSLAWEGIRALKQPSLL